MDIHKPKAAHSWREFLIEIGTIVCGILIALGLEQMVVRAEWAHKVHAAREAMKDELLWDDGPQVYQRVAMHDCLIGRLNDIRKAVESNAPRAEVTRLVNSYQVTFVSYDTRARDDASHAGVMDHMPLEEQSMINASYDQMPYIEKANTEEAMAIGRMRALNRNGAGLSVTEQDRVLDAVEALRVLEFRIWGAAGYMLPVIRKQGALDPVRMRFFVGEARKWYGSTCVHDLPANWHIPAGAETISVQ